MHRLLGFILRNREAAFLLVLGIVFSFPLFQGFYLSHDGPAHVARSAQYFAAFSDGQLIPRWAPTLNFGYGSPVLIIFYPLGGYLISLFHYFGLSFEASYLFIMISAFIAGPLIFYMFAKQEFSNSTAFLASVLYASLPYRFLTTHVRGAVGEAIGITLLPAVFYCVTKLHASNKNYFILIMAVLYGLIVLAHNGTILLFTPVVVAYSFLFGRQTFIKSVVAILFGLLLSAFFWIPSILESKYTNGIFYFRDMFKDQFSSITSLIYSNWGFGHDTNLPGGLSPQVGIAAWIVVLVLLFLIFVKNNAFKKGRRFILFWVAFFAIGIFMSTSFSSILWEASDFLKRFQFPWRFAALSAFSSAVLSLYFFSKVRNLLLKLGLVALALLFGLTFTSVEKHTTNSDLYYQNYSGSTYFRSEGTTIWLAGDPSKKAEQQIQFIEGAGKISSLNKRTASHSFTVVAQKPSKVVDNTVFFPGWKAYVNGSQVPVQFQDVNYRGLITFDVPKGKSEVAVRFEETKIRHIANFTSLVSILLFVIVLIASRLSLLRRKGW